MTTEHRRNTAILIGALCLAGCGGGGGGSGSPSGVFLDSAVSGLTTTSGALVDETDAQGRFSYNSGQIVMFSIGDVVLGLAQGQAVMTPVDLISGAVDEMDDGVTNIARFLQTVDWDEDPTNGIQIDESLHTAAMGVTIDNTAGGSDEFRSQLFTGPKIVNRLEEIAPGLPAVVSIRIGGNHDALLWPVAVSRQKHRKS